MSTHETCPWWCTFDHDGPIHAEPGEHQHELVELDELTGVSLYLAEEGEAEVNVWVGGHDTVLTLEEAPRRLREMAVMLVEAAQKLEDLDLLGEKLVGS